MDAMLMIWFNHIICIYQEFMNKMPGMLFDISGDIHYFREVQQRNFCPQFFLIFYDRDFYELLMLRIIYLTFN